MPQRGAAPNPLVMETDPLRRKQLAVAHHDAGHAVVATLLGHTIHKLTLVVGNPKHDGFFLGTYGQDAPYSCECTTAAGLPVITPMLAGRVAEAKAGFGDVYPGGDIGDLEFAAEIAQKTAPTPEEMDSLLAEAHAAVVVILDQPAVWSGVEKLAAELLRVGHLSRKDVTRTLTSIKGWASAVQWIAKTNPALVFAASQSGEPEEPVAGLQGLTEVAKVSRLIGEFGWSDRLREFADVVNSCGGVKRFRRTLEVVDDLLGQSRKHR